MMKNHSVLIRIEGHWDALRHKVHRGTRPTSMMWPTLILGAVWRREVPGAQGARLGASNQLKGVTYDNDE